jgi:hypothetical protein
MSLLLPPITYSLPLTTADVRWYLAVGMGIFSVPFFEIASYAKVLVNISVELTPPTTNNIPLTKLAVNALRVSGQFAPWLHLSEAGL